MRNTQTHLEHISIQPQVTNQEVPQSGKTCRWACDERTNKRMPARAHQAPQPLSMCAANPHTSRHMKLHTDTVNRLVHIQQKNHVQRDPSTAPMETGRSKDWQAMGIPQRFQDPTWEWPFVWTSCMGMPQLLQAIKSSGHLQCTLLSLWYLDIQLAAVEAWS